jgi:hypothetical protein
VLSETAVRNAKAREKPYKLFDGRSLFNSVTAGDLRLHKLDSTDCSRPSEGVCTDRGL